WKRDPFDPTMADGKFWGRGCGDTKGNLIMQLLAVQAWQRVEGRPPINLKFVVEGEEEVGSPHFASFVHANKEILKADGATIEGGDHLHEGTPKIELGCKGILYVEMVSRTASVDQHSSYAAIAPNPGWRLIHFLTTLRDANGRIKIPGWYEDARRPTARELRYLRASAFSADALKGFWGVKHFIGGENNFELLRRLIYSPTCTICGFVSGYIEEGTKTVNPAVAKAKIDFRLVPNMKKEKQLAKLRDHLKSKGFEDIELRPAPENLEAAAISLAARVVKAAIKGSVDAYGREPEVWPWSAGASAHGFFNEVVGVPSISGPGVSYDGSNYHAPNENIRLTDFIGGSKHMAAMFARM
ncbi:MAG: M20/M25/M40 family metallo-hydrolase, partial [Methanobacteriota archaeon]